MSNRPVVYIASPYTKGDVAVNVRLQCQVFDEMMNEGIVWPVAPLWSHFQHTVFPRPYKDWLAYDLAMIHRYDACLRLVATCPLMPGYFQAESSGADGEVAEFIRLGLPVFYDRASLYEWARKR